MKYYPSIKGKWGGGGPVNHLPVSVGKEHRLSFARNVSSGTSQSALSVPAKLHAHQSFGWGSPASQPSEVAVSFSPCTCETEVPVLLLAVGCSQLPEAPHFNTM